VIDAYVGLATENLIIPAFFLLPVPSCEISMAIVIKLDDSKIKLVMLIFPLNPVDSLKAP
jgi:hypothetical protein